MVAFIVDDKHFSVFCIDLDFIVLKILNEGLKHFVVLLDDKHGWCLIFKTLQQF